MDENLSLVFWTSKKAKLIMGFLATGVGCFSYLCMKACADATNDSINRALLEYNITEKGGE